MIEIRNHVALFASCSLACLLLLSGCDGVYRSDPVIPELARETLRQALEQWQAGASAESMRERSPEIVVQDIDWSSGSKLIAFDLLEVGKPVDANLIAKVKLTLQTSAGKQQEKTVTYVVGTSPVLTVFRGFGD